MIFQTIPMLHRVPFVSNFLSRLLFSKFLNFEPPMTCTHFNNKTVGIPAENEKCYVHKENICDSCFDNYHKASDIHTCHLLVCF